MRTGAKLLVKQFSRFISHKFRNGACCKCKGLLVSNPDRPPTYKGGEREEDGLGNRLATLLANGMFTPLY